MHDKMTNLDSMQTKLELNKAQLHFRKSVLNQQTPEFPGVWTLDLLWSLQETQTISLCQQLSHGCEVYNKSVRYDMADTVRSFSGSLVTGNEYISTLGKPIQVCCLMSPSRSCIIEQSCLMHHFGVPCLTPEHPCAHLDSEKVSRTPFGLPRPVCFHP